MIDKTKLLDILYDWNLWGDTKRDIGIERNVTKKIIDLLGIHHIIVLKGIRRSGKSTIMFQLMNELLKSKIEQNQLLYVNFEEPFFAGETSISLMQQIYEVYRENINPGKFTYLFLDEVQYIKEWERWVTATHEKKGMKIFVTGSSSALLSKEFSTLLTGRHISFEIFPLSFTEMLRFKKFSVKGKSDVRAKRRKIKYYLNEYLRWGGFPEVILQNRDEVKKVILKQYFEDIIYRDVLERFKIRDIEALKKLGIYYITNTCNKISFRNLAQNLDIPPEVVRRFSSYLQESYLVDFIPIYSYSLKKQMRNKKKVYAIDTGMRNVVGFVFSRDVGRNLENVVFLELKRRGNKIYYWADNNEVDFVVEHGREKQLINVTAEGHRVKDRELKGLINASKKLKLKNISIITEDTEKIEKSDGVVIKYVPLYHWLLEDRVSVR